MNKQHKPQLDFETLDVIKELKTLIHKVNSANKAELDCLTIEIYNYITKFEPLKLYFQEQVKLYENFIETDKCREVYEKFSNAFKKMLKDNDDIKSIDLNWWQTYCLTHLPIFNHVIKNNIDKDFDFSKVSSLLVFYYTVLQQNKITDIDLTEAIYLNGLECYFHYELINDGIITSINNVNIPIIKVILISVLQKMITVIKAKNLNLARAVEYKNPYTDEMKCLSAKEKEVFEALIIKRLSTKETAETMCISENTLRSHIVHISSTLNVKGLKGLLKKYK